MAKAARQKDPIPALEWVAAAAGLLVALALLGIIAWQAVFENPSEVPILAAEVEGVEPTGTGQVVRIRVTNRSGQTAAAVQVEGKLGGETSNATFDYVPGNSEAQGGLVFAGGQADAKPIVRVTGYQLP